MKRMYMFGILSMSAVLSISIMNDYFNPLCKEDWHQLYVAVGATFFRVPDQSVEKKLLALNNIIPLLCNLSEIKASYYVLKMAYDLAQEEVIQAKKCLDCDEKIIQLHEQHSKISKDKYESEEKRNNIREKIVQLMPDVYGTSEWGKKIHALAHQNVKIIALTMQETLAHMNDEGMYKFMITIQDGDKKIEKQLRLPIHSSVADIGNKIFEILKDN